MTRVRPSVTASGLLALVLATGALTGSLPGVPGLDGDADLRPVAGSTSPGTTPLPSEDDVAAARERVAQAGTAVERVQARIDEAAAIADAAADRAARAAEAYNGARYRAVEARRARASAVVAARRAAAALAVQEDDFRAVVIATGSQGPDLGAATALLQAQGMEGLIDRVSSDRVVKDLLAARQRAWEQADARARATREDAARTARAAETALADAREARDRASGAAREAAAAQAALASRRERLVRQLARLQGVSVALARQRQVGLAARREAAREAAARRAAAREAAREAAARAAARAARPSRPSRPSGPGRPHRSDDADRPDRPDRPDTPPAAPARGSQAAIAFARAQLGEPYVWGAAGPGSWDCSGLTSAAWAAAGKQLPHYSVAQYDAATPIAPGDLQPGDLVFWGDSGSPSSIYHVALYIGGGRIIHAPRTGRPVSEDSLYYWRTPNFYARP